MADGKFTAETKETLGKRAALTCSNPDCGVLTTGPTSEPTGAINIGEAAHIFGRTSQSARFHGTLSNEELSDITNGVWLCRNCHKAIDNDPPRYPADLLYEWRRQHEAKILTRLGRPGDQMREKLKENELRLFSDASHLAQQIVLDRPKRWEFKLAAELLRTELGAVLVRWQRLQRGMYVRKYTLIDSDKWFNWVGAKNTELSRIIAALSPLLDALTASFGPIGTPGDPKEILEVCRLITSAAQNLLDWEEDIRFAHVEERFRDVLSAMQGAGGHLLEEIFTLQAEIAKFISSDVAGHHQVTIVLNMPDGYVERVNAAYEKLAESFKEE